MEFLGLAIVVSTVLYLIDKNGQWSRFWRITKRATVGLVAAAILAAAGFYFYQRHESAKAVAASTQVATDDYRAGLIPKPVPQEVDPRLPPGMVLDKPEQSIDLSAGFRPKKNYKPCPTAK